MRAGIQGGGCDVRGTRVWACLLGLARAVVEDVWIGEEGEVVVAAWPRGRAGGSVIAVGSAVDDRLGLTSATAVGAGVR